MKHHAVLITGGAGFIGSHLAQRLRDLGKEVTVLDVVPPPLALKRLGPRIDYIQGSVTDPALVEQLVPRHDCIFHLAALLGVRRTMEQPVEMIENNLCGTMNILKQAWLHKKRLVFASSSEVYGKNSPPFTESSDHLYGPTSKLRWSYAIAKSLEENLCLGYAQKGGAITIVRYFNVYGPRQSSGPYSGVIAKFVRAALRGEEVTVYGDGQQTRSFLYVSDAVEATIRAAGEAACGEIINIGSNEEIAVAQLAQKVVSICRSNSRITYLPFHQVYPEGFEEIPRRFPDITRLQTLLQYGPQVSLEEGLLRTAEYFRQEEGL